MNRFESIVPILGVKDVRASIDYYVTKLGFRKRWEWDEPPDFACVGRDDTAIFLSRSKQVASSMWLSVFVENVDALYEDYKERGARIQEPPADYPWGMREMTVEDLDGHRLRMGTGNKGPIPREDLFKQWTDEGGA